MQRFHITLLRFAFTFLVTGIVFALRAQTPASTNHELRAKAVNAVRVINTAEYNYRHEKGRFGSWQELYASGAVTTVEKSRPQFTGLSLSEAPEVIPGYRLDVVVAADGSTYSVALHRTENQDCGFSVFSDQRGIIYQGKAIDCPID